MGTPFHFVELTENEGKGQMDSPKNDVQLNARGPQAPVRS
jgi:hypothetical protein